MADNEHIGLKKLLEDDQEWLENTIRQTMSEESLEVAAASILKALQMPNPSAVEGRRSTKGAAGQPQHGTAPVTLTENPLLEAVRHVIMDLVEKATEAGANVLNYRSGEPTSATSKGHIFRILDIVLYMCQQNMVEGGVIFTIIEDLMEMLTLDLCEELFQYVATWRDALKQPEVYSRGKLILLRTCNRLLRRLSKKTNPVLSGQITIFLSHFFEITNRSCINTSGTFNTSNTTEYEKDPGPEVDADFYLKFWRLQEFFAKPGSAGATAMNNSWQMYSADMSFVLSRFESEPLLGSFEEECGGILPVLGEDEISCVVKYLTSPKLMSLELKDLAFRRHFLVQCLIILDYLKSPGKQAKAAPNAKDAAKETNRVADVTAMAGRVKRILESSEPNGKEFLHNMERVIARDKNWQLWKRDGCNSFERSATDPAKPETAGGPAAGTAAHGGGPPPAKRPRLLHLGNRDLHRIWLVSTKKVDVLRDAERTALPKVEEYWAPLADAMDPANGIEEEYNPEHDAVFCWKGLRYTAAQDSKLLTRVVRFGVKGVVPVSTLSDSIRDQYMEDKVDKKDRQKDGGSVGMDSPEHADDTEANGDVAMLEEVENGRPTSHGSGPTPMDMDRAPPTDPTKVRASTPQRETTPLLPPPSSPPPPPKASTTPARVSSPAPTHATGGAARVASPVLGVKRKASPAVTTTTREGSKSPLRTAVSPLRTSHSPLRVGGGVAHGEGGSSTLVGVIGGAGGGVPAKRPSVKSGASPSLSAEAKARTEGERRGGESAMAGEVGGAGKGAGGAEAQPGKVVVPPVQVKAEEGGGGEGFHVKGGGEAEVSGQDTVKVEEDMVEGAVFEGVEDGVVASGNGGEEIRGSSAIAVGGGGGGGKGKGNGAVLVGNNGRDNGTAVKVELGVGLQGVGGGGDQEAAPRVPSTRSRRRST